MKKLIISLTSCLSAFCLLAFSAEVNASPINYCVSGTMGFYNETEDLYKEIELGGYIVFDDVDVSLDPWWEIYQVTEFDFLISEYTFYGNSGSIERSPSDDFLFLDGDGDWNHWGFDTEVNNLGIGLPFAMHYGEGCGYGNQHEVILYDGYHLVGSQDLELTRVPVPEPATILLFGTGLAGLAGLRLRTRKKKDLRWQ